MGISKTEIGLHGIILLASILISILVTSLIFYQFNLIESLFKLSKTGSVVLFGFLLALALLILLEIVKCIILRLRKNTKIENPTVNRVLLVNNPMQDRRRSDPNPTISPAQIAAIKTVTTCKTTIGSGDDNSDALSESSLSSSESSITPMPNLKHTTEDTSNDNLHSTSASASDSASPIIKNKSDNKNALVIEPSRDNINAHCIPRNIIQQHLRTEEAERVLTTETKYTQQMICSLKIDLSDGIDIVWINREKHFYIFTDRNKVSSERTYHNFNNLSSYTGITSVTYHNENSTVYGTNDKNNFVLETIDANGGSTYSYVKYNYDTREISDIKVDEFEDLGQDKIDPHNNDMEKLYNNRKEEEPIGPVPTAFPLSEELYIKGVKVYQAAAPVVKQLSNLGAGAVRGAMSLAGSISGFNNPFTANTITTANSSTLCGRTSPDQTLFTTTINDRDDEIASLLDPTKQEIENAKNIQNTLRIYTLYRDLEEELNISIEQANKIREGNGIQNLGIHKIWINGTLCFNYSYSDKIYKLEDSKTEIKVAFQDKVTYYDAETTVCLWNIVGLNKRNQAIGTVVLKTYGNDNTTSYKKVFFNLDTREIVELTKGELKFIKENQQIQLHPRA